MSILTYTHYIYTYNNNEKGTIKKISWSHGVTQKNAYFAYKNSQAQILAQQKYKQNKAKSI